MKFSLCSFSITLSFRLIELIFLTLEAFLTTCKTSGFIYTIKSILKKYMNPREWILTKYFINRYSDEVALRT